MTNLLNILDILAHSGIFPCIYKAQWILDRLPSNFTTEQVLLVDSLVENYSTI